MISKIHSAIPTGFTAQRIEVEGNVSQGLPSFNIVGMGSKSIVESKERVRSSLKNSGFSVPDTKLTINLAPASLLKDGAYLDLPIALSVLTASKQLLPLDTKDSFFVGELSLTGALRPVPGIINIIELAKKTGVKTAYIPIGNLGQAQLVSGVEIIGVETLEELYLILKGQKAPKTDTPNAVKNTKTGVEPVFLDDIRGQKFAKRALTVAIAGGHNILFTGPPGAGKTLLAKSALGLLPPLSQEERISVTKLHSLGNNMGEIVTERPFRAPHHTCSLAAFLGSPEQPGEISLAHNGVLFLDEFPEYPRNLLEALRQPLEDRAVKITRLRGQSTYPADFIMIGTMNPCPCGHLGDPDHECSCSLSQIQNYQKKLSGPLLDRIDLYVAVDRPETADLLLEKPSSLKEHTEAKFLVAKARQRQKQRYGAKGKSNASLSSREVAQCCKLKPAAQKLLQAAAERLQLSARSYFKTIKVAQTIADLESAEEVSAAHISEALTYRRRE